MTFVSTHHNRIPNGHVTHFLILLPFQINMPYRRTRTTNYRASLMRKPNALFRRGPYKARRNVPVISRGGVGGGASKMSGPTTYAPEVKFHDIDITVAPATSNWAIVSSNSLFNILQGVGQGDRLGRKIRVVGVVLRAAVNTDTGTGFFSPYTMDFLWDEQTNGGPVPAITSIYTGLAPQSLPEPVNEQRFKFFKRYKVNNPNTPLTLVDVAYKCNKIIEYKENEFTGTIADLASTNLIITFCAPSDATPNLNGKLRILFVDE